MFKFFLRNLLFFKTFNLKSIFLYEAITVCVNTSQQKLLWLIRHSWTIIPWARGPREKQVKRSVKHIDDQLKNFAVRLGADESLNIPQLPCLFVSNFISGKH